MEQGYDMMLALSSGRAGNEHEAGQDARVMLRESSWSDEYVN